MIAQVGKKPRIWGPKDDTWTYQKAKAHQSFSARHKIKPSWEEYLRLREVALENIRSAGAKGEHPRRKSTGAKALRRAPQEIVAKILAKVGAK